MEAKALFEVNVNADNGVISFPLVDGELESKATFIHVQRLVSDGQYETKYRISMLAGAPSTFVPSYECDYDRIYVEYANGNQHLIWCRQTHQSVIKISAAKYHKVNGKFQKVCNTPLPRENLSSVLWVTIKGGMETCVMAKDVWVSPYSGEISPIIWDDDELFDELETESDFDMSMLNLDDTEIHDMAKNMALAFNDAAKDNNLINGGA